MYIIFNESFSLFFFLMTYCLLFILDYGNDFRQKANSSNFFKIQVQNGS